MCNLKKTDAKLKTVVCEGNTFLIEGTAKAKEPEWKEVC